MVVGLLAERPSQHMDRLGQVALFDDHVRPDDIQEDCFLDHLTRVLDQIEQDADRLRCQIHRLPVPGSQNSTPGIEFETP
jgi:hypothetical protein